MEYFRLKTWMGRVLGRQKSTTAMNQSHSRFQLIWGIALMLAGAGVFYRIPQVLPEIAKMASFAGSTWVVRICFYIIAVVLLGGGLRKIVRYMKENNSG